VIMKDRPKLGRGLSDVSRFFLSGSPQYGQHHDGNTSPAFTAGTVGILSPASPSMQAFFTANLVLEIARRRLAARVWDYATAADAKVMPLMRSLLEGHGTEQEGPVGIVLYGLPRVEILDRAPEEFYAGTRAREAAPDAAESEGYAVTLVNARPDIEFIMKSEPVDDFIIITRTDEMSLLQAYAFIKVMDARSRSSSVWVVFDEGEGRDLQLIFDVLAGFVTRTLEKPIGFLGALVHDESLEHSIRDEKPLVLLSRPSAAREALTGICSRFMDGRQQKAGETPS